MNEGRYFFSIWEQSFDRFILLANTSSIMKTDENNEEHLLGYLMLDIYVITKEGGDYWISDKVWAVLSVYIDIPHRSELSRLFSSDDTVDNRAPHLTPTRRPHHRFVGKIKSQLASLDVLVYWVFGLNCPNILTSHSVLLRITGGEVFSLPVPRYLQVPVTTVSTAEGSFVSEMFPVDLH